MKRRRPIPPRLSCLALERKNFAEWQGSFGFRKTRQTGSHERWHHPDGRATTIPMHGGQEIGPPLFHRIVSQLGIDTETFARLRGSFPDCRFSATRSASVCL